MSQIKLKRVELTTGETLAYRRVGSGAKTLLFIHGNMNSSKNWDLVLENLPADYQAYAPDLRGFGESTYNQSIEKMADFAADLKLFIEELDLNPYGLIGWSAGGAVAMRFVLDYPDLIERLVLMESCSISGYPVKEDGDYLTTAKEHAGRVKPILWAQKHKDTFLLGKLARWLAKKVFASSLFVNKTPSDERYEAYIEEMLKQRNLIDINLAIGEFNLSEEFNGVVEGSGEASDISLPTLIIQGEDDEVVTPEMAEKTAAGIGDNAELVKLNNVGHVPPVDNLDKTLELITEFL